jgi:hypothetical protein
MLWAPLLALTAGKVIQAEQAGLVPGKVVPVTPRAPAPAMAPAVAWAVDAEAAEPRGFDPLSGPEWQFSQVLEGMWGEDLDEHVRAVSQAVLDAEESGAELDDATVQALCAVDRDFADVTRAAGLSVEEGEAVAGSRSGEPRMQGGFSGEAKRRVKVKQPKQKVKAPAPQVAAALAPERTFFEGPPSITETIIPGASVLTVVGIIPFSASLARQAWTRYKITDRRIEVASGFQGKDVVQILYREITDVKWLRRYGGAAGDVVLTLQDDSKLEIRSLSDFDRNLAFLMSQVAEDTLKASEYPDKPARDYQAKVEAGELEKPELPPYVPE